MISLMIKIVGVWLVAILIGLPLFASMGLAAFAFVVFGGLSPSLRVILRSNERLTLEGTIGYVHNAGNLHLGGSGNEVFETLRAYYGLVGVTYAF